MIFLLVEIHIFPSLRNTNLEKILGNCFLINSFDVNFVIAI